ncbi:hypothetical protein IU469_30840 [Nocardia puris]|uniref:hypothetical protein n=1 Tax=Nocardia puris TaxID=208602 RepID=UPI0018963096|nr:hypothetical protein [Nocardia puris]MBF6213142.1 hypothetical protein [Nocardia puris]MBF6370071.1 hypothetical protein [Nocardia puris]
MTDSSFMISGLTPMTVRVLDEHRCALPCLVDLGEETATFAGSPDSVAEALRQLRERVREVERQQGRSVSYHRFRQLILKVESLGDPLQPAPPPRPLYKVPEWLVPGAVVEVQYVDERGHLAKLERTTVVVIGRRNIRLATDGRRVRFTRRMYRADEDCFVDGRHSTARILRAAAASSDANPLPEFVGEPDGRGPSLDAELGDIETRVLLDDLPDDLRASFARLMEQRIAAKAEWVHLGSGSLSVLTIRRFRASVIFRRRGDAEIPAGWTWQVERDGAIVDLGHGVSTEDVARRRAEESMLDQLM